MALYKQSDIILAVDTLRKYDTHPHGSIFLEEWAFIYRLVRNTKVKTILEIGSWYHVSSLAFLTALSHNGGGKLISVDLNFPLDLSYDDEKVKWIKIKGSSFDVVPTLKGIDLSFVDGAHGREAVKTDLVNSLSILNKGGLIMAHDINYEPTRNGIAEIINLDDCFIWSSQPDKFHGILVYPNILSSKDAALSGRK